uniref:Uncharacterized protein n=1 Tax=Anguilla anguilla TaxID=7936 RepID=A0A0E9VLW9_ANGAN
MVRSSAEGCHSSHRIIKRPLINKIKCKARKSSLREAALHKSLF